MRDGQHSLALWKIVVVVEQVPASHPYLMSWDWIYTRVYETRRRIIKSISTRKFVSSPWQLHSMDCEGLVSSCLEIDWLAIFQTQPSGICNSFLEMLRNLNLNSLTRNVLLPVDAAAS